jgi:hypothetical protein
VRCKVDDNADVDLDVGDRNPGDTARVAVPMSDFEAKWVQQKWVYGIEEQGLVKW